MTDTINPQPAEPVPGVAENPVEDLEFSSEQETPVDESVETHEPAKKQRKGPGRPRVAEVVERDDKIFARLSEAGPQQVRELADATGYDRNKTYLSLWRLRKEGRVEYARHGARRLWSVVG